MAFVVTGGCQNCYHKDCVEVCPCDCFYGDEINRMIYIHPDECTDCYACLPVCPEEVFPEDELPAELLEWIQINKEKSQSGLPNITHKD